MLYGVFGLCSKYLGEFASVSCVYLAVTCPCHVLSESVCGHSADRGMLSGAIWSCLQSRWILPVCVAMYRLIAR